VIADVSRLHGVAVGPGTATVGAGANLVSMYAELAAKGVTVPGGTCPTVGIAGLALGGGYGYAARRLGLTTDNLRSVRIVTADGRLLTCDASHHSDLFWACRGGGGGNFGVATSFVFSTHPAPAVTTYELRWPTSQTLAAFAAWQRFAPSAPDALTSAFELLASPPSEPSVVSAGQYFGSESALQALIEPLTSVGTPTLTTRTLPYLDAVLHWARCRELATCTNKRVDFDARSDYITKPLPAAAASLLVEGVAKRRGGPGYVLIDAYGGAINRVPRTATAFVHRDTLFSIQYAAQPGGAWLDNLYAAMRPYASGYAYQNYIDPTLADWRHAYYGVNLARLQAVKRKYDPGNAFRFAQSIPLR
jgi:FAD/FMN-containing dehydrogenase